MNQVANDLWLILISAIVSAIGMYIGFINNLRTKVTVLEGDVKELQESTCMVAVVLFVVSILEKRE